MDVDNILVYRFKEFIMKQLDIKDLEKISGGITEGGCVLPVINFSWMRWFWSDKVLPRGCSRLGKDVHAVALTGSIFSDDILIGMVLGNRDEIKSAAWNRYCFWTLPCSPFCLRCIIFFQIRFIPFAIAWFFIGIVYISHDLGGRKTFEKPNGRVGRNGLSYGRRSDFW